MAVRYGLPVIVEIEMRLTVLINGPDPPANHKYAVLWLDTVQQRWSRESHTAFDLPEWGELSVVGGAATLRAPGSPTRLCTLRGLGVDRYEKVSSAQGEVTWPEGASQAASTWLWHLQAVDRAPFRAENPLFGP